MSKPRPLTISLEFDDLPTMWLAPCPFCGGADLELNNTWTPAYWIDCICGARMDGDTNRRDLNNPRSMAAHKRAAISAVVKWNARNCNISRVVRERCATLARNTDAAKGMTLADSIAAAIDRDGGGKP